MARGNNKALVNMLRKDIKLDGPITVQVGDVQFKITRIGERAVHLGVDAPRNMKISFDGEGMSAPADKSHGCATDSPE